MFRSKKDVPFRWHHCQVLYSAYHRWGTAMAIAPTSYSFLLCSLNTHCQDCLCRHTAVVVLRLLFRLGAWSKSSHQSIYLVSFLRKGLACVVSICSLLRGFPKKYGKFLYLSIISLSCQKILALPQKYASTSSAEMLRAEYQNMSWSCTANVETVHHWLLDSKC